MVGVYRTKRGRVGAGGEGRGHMSELFQIIWPMFTPLKNNLINWWASSNFRCPAKRNRRLCV